MFRQAFGTYADVLKECEAEFTNQLTKQFFHIYFERIIDMEHTVFRQNMRPIQSGCLIRDSCTIPQRLLFSIASATTNGYYPNSIRRGAKTGNKLQGVFRCNLPIWPVNWSCFTAGTGDGKSCSKTSSKKILREV